MEAKAQALLAEYRATRKAADPVPAEKSASVAAPKPETQTVTGEKLKPVSAEPHRWRLLLWPTAGLVFLALLIYGFVRRKGTIQ